MRFMIYFWLAISCLLFTNIAESATTNTTTVIELKYKTVAEVLPLLQPLVSAGGSVSGINNQLVISTTPENLVDLKQVLAQIDTLPRQLVISVKQSGREARDSVVLRGQVNVMNGKPEFAFRAKQSQAAEDDKHIQQIKVLEGRQAAIQVGRAVPVSVRDEYGETTFYHPATTGFYVTPQITGNSVTLHIMPFSNQVTRQGNSFKISEAETTLSVPLGEWVNIADTAQSVTKAGNGRSVVREQQQEIWLKVDRVANP